MIDFKMKHSSHFVDLFRKEPFIRHKIVFFENLCCQLQAIMVNNLLDLFVIYYALRDDDTNTF